jgi:hypothetical protein
MKRWIFVLLIVILAGFFAYLAYQKFFTADDGPVPIVIPENTEPLDIDFNDDPDGNRLSTPTSASQIME